MKNYKTGVVNSGSGERHNDIFNTTANIDTALLFMIKQSRESLGEGHL